MEIMKYLIEKGAPVDQADKSGRTALHWASISGHKDAAEILLGKVETSHPRASGGHRGSLGFLSSAALLVWFPGAMRSMCASSMSARESCVVRTLPGEHPARRLADGLPPWAPTIGKRSQRARM